MSGPRRRWSARALSVAALLALSLSAPARPAPGAGEAGRAGPPSGPWVVRFRPGTSAAARVALLAARGLAPVDDMAGTDFVLARPAAARADVAPGPGGGSVLAAQPVATLRAMGPAQAPPAPDDPLFPAQWHLRAVGIPDAWQVSTGVGATVAVLDTGVAYEDDGTHRRAPDLAGTRFAAGWDFLDDDAHPDDEALPGMASHGTHMAGTIAQTTGNGLGGAGVAPGATIMPVRVLAPDGTGTSWAIAKGLRFAADHGAQVANLSLGGASGSPELEDAVAYAIGRGVTVVVSSGDQGTAGVSYPAAYPGVVAVGAVRFDDVRAVYANYGPRLDLVAPGGELGADRNGDGLEDGVVQQGLFGDAASFCFCFKEGTSSAAAHVSGVAALVVASGRAAHPADVRGLLLSTAQDLGAPGRDDEYGAGLVHAGRALGMAGFPDRPAPPTVPAPPAPEGPADGVGPRLSAPTTVPPAPSRPLGSARGAPVGRSGPWVAMVVVALAGLLLLGLLARRRPPRRLGQDEQSPRP